MGRSLVNAAAMNQLAEIACEAGGAAMEFYGRLSGVDVKEDNSPVTDADRAAHEVILTALTRWDSGAPVVSEEGTLPPFEERRRWDRFWLVDPLDGTKEFIAANGEFTVNVALVENGEPVLGVVAAPALGTVYVAAAGFGAWKHVRSEAPQRVGAAARSSGVTRVVESRSHPSSRLEAFIATLGPVERIRLGSSLKFCRVAEGGADLYPRFGRTMEWDVAAGDCVYRNSTFDGRRRQSPLAYNQPSLSAPEFVIGSSNGCGHNIRP